MSLQTDVIIIGAGSAGLSAAKEHSKQVESLRNLPGPTP
jgi:ribulose 1,5-bisphosphate synthetase/thiazole synthase